MFAIDPRPSRCQPDAMRLWLIASVLLVTSLVAAAGPNRTLVTGAPKIGDREIPRLILMQSVRINRFAPGLTNADMAERLMGQMLAGQLVPVSEDAKGVYYQSTRGFQREGATSSVPAGLYVSKTRANVIYVYTGEARDLAEGLTMDVQPLSTADMAKLKIGAPLRKAAK